MDSGRLMKEKELGIELTVKDSVCHWRNVKSKKA